MAITDDGPIAQQFPLGPQWPVMDPFLFAAHHHDDYPPGDGQLAPARSLVGRQIGSDFSGRDGWSMYHGSRVPGFPQHPHRGFETITHVRCGLVDHADSMGATARFGQGDTQWMTAGSGIQHSEMFPLVDEAADNPLEMFQIWLNLPAADKMVDPYFTMMWRETTPVVTTIDGQGATTEITVIAGRLDGVHASSPPPNSWASRPEGDVAVWHLEMGNNAGWELPAAHGPDTRRVLYLYGGSTVSIAPSASGASIAGVLSAGTGAVIDARQPLTLQAESGGASIVILQGRPLGEPVAQRGPFVMNTQEQLMQAFEDYRTTEFGGWPWPGPDPHHGNRSERFAIHADGNEEIPTSVAG